MDNKEIILIGLFIWNTMVFLTYAVDKYKATRRQWRIPEATLILLALAGGGLGAFLGMYLIRHKTRHPKFRILVPATVVIQTVLAVWLIAGM